MISYLMKVIHKFQYAFNGLFHGIIHDFSIRLQVILGFITIASGIVLSFNRLEWIIVILLIFLVIGIEFINSALEHVVDFVSPQYHDEAKIIKDYGAAAVLCISIAAFVIACIIIGGKLV
ncbi:MAG: diacylglycerol kinase family protein [Erysipelotrichaceae bacterium]